jgi:hypothetical protein
MDKLSPDKKKNTCKNKSVVGNARKETEKELGRSVIFKQVFLDNNNKMKLE